MNDYQIEITDSAQTDLKAIVQYIQTDLIAPSTASKFLNEIQKAMEQLAFMPEKFQLVRDDYLANKGYRYLGYKKYLIFYTINDRKHTVFIHRIIHSSRQWEYLI